MKRCGEPRADTIRVDEIDSDRSQILVVQAYARLAFLDRRGEGANYATLARFGQFEVRLFEVWLDGAPADFPFLWIELFSHRTKAAVDSCGRGEFGAAGSAAEGFIRDAWSRHKWSDDFAPFDPEDAVTAE